MPILLTEKAATEIKKIVKEQGLPETDTRLRVELPPHSGSIRSDDRQPPGRVPGCRLPSMCARNHCPESPVEARLGAAADGAAERLLPSRAVEQAKAAGIDRQGDGLPGPEPAGAGARHVGDDGGHLDAAEGGHHPGEVTLVHHVLDQRVYYCGRGYSYDEADCETYDAERL